MKIAIIIPAYNEAKRISGVLDGLKKIGLEVFVIDDGSRDKTAEVVQKYKVNFLRHKINLGKGAALRTACEAAFSKGADGVIMLDSDGQHKLEDLPKFIEALQSGRYDVVFGSRNLNFGVPLVRFTGNKMASVLVSLLFGIYVSDLICGYRAFTKEAYKKMNWQSVGYGVETEMVALVGKRKLRYCEVPVETVYYKKLRGEEKFKGVSILEAFGILLDVFRWKVTL